MERERERKAAAGPGSEPWRRKEEQQVRATYLTARRVEAGHSVFGMVYFYAPRMGKDALLRVPLGQATYEIPFELKK